MCLFSHHKNIFVTKIQFKLYNTVDDLSLQDVEEPNVQQTNMTETTTRFRLLAEQSGLPQVIGGTSASLMNFSNPSIILVHTTICEIMR